MSGISENSCAEAISGVNKKSVEKIAARIIIPLMNLSKASCLAYGFDWINSVDCSLGLYKGCRADQ